MAPLRSSSELVVFFFLNLLFKNVTSYIPMAGQFGRSRSLTRSLNSNDHTPFKFISALASTSKSIAEVDLPVSFIDTEMRGAAMKLHTRMQAPKEGQVADKPVKNTYVTTHADYLAFLVDSQHVYAAFEDAVNSNIELERFRDTGMERTKPLETDIQFIVDEYDTSRPAVGDVGLEYAERIKMLASENKIPEFMCLFYNHYFAHTAGGMMIGKRMAYLLLKKRTLDFYKWEGDINEIKAQVKANIEEFVLSWSSEERQRCVDQTAAAFNGGGSINSYLGGRNAKR